MSATAELIAFVSGLDEAQLPAAVREQAQRCVLDCLGVAITGSQTPMARVSSRWAYETGSLGFRMMLAVDNSPRPTYGDCCPL